MDSIVSSNNSSIANKDLEVVDVDRHSKSETWIKQRVDELIKEVKVMLHNIAADPPSQMDMIDSLQRLGVAYHFEEEITESLSKLNENTLSDHGDLNATALRFRLLRQHRYYVSCDVFNKFRDEKGSFNSSLQSDVKGLLSLYEAAYLALPGEELLDEAIIFTTTHLKSLVDRLEKPLAKKVLHALEVPSHRRMKRLEARLYISLYEDDDEARNDVILELAKLDFHLLQSLHREEVKNLSLWYHDLGVKTKLTYARDRMVECYFWVLGVYYEPYYSRARMMMAKFMKLFSLIDDTYDSYGTLEELQPLTDVIQRWDEKAAAGLGECYELLIRVLFGTVKESEKELAPEGKSYRVNYIVEMIKKGTQGMLQETKWRDEKYVPPLQDHLQITLFTCLYMALGCASFLGMGPEATEEAFKWASSNPKIAKAIATICRLLDDVVGHEFETGRNNVATAVTCYMKENNASLEEASETLLKMIEDAWKDTNHEYLKLTWLPTSLLMPYVNLARMMEILYRECDKYTNVHLLKEYIELRKSSNTSEIIHALRRNDTIEHKI
ncbi:putative terpene synthase 2 [Ananas comosus]|uniref:Putative terpene synthase 2 n=1 Tax=Ananas comosus TaxID=4615 RepID=A0A199VVC0_ANACO|nr:putative terpene synthase 2 [Ananas comosus]